MNTKITVVTASTDTDVREETKFVTLNDSGFVRGATAQDQWHMLVNEAWKVSRLPENVMVKEYLGFMLWRFMKESDLFKKLQAFDIFSFLLHGRTLEGTLLQDIADMSLQYVSYFPERSKHRHEPRSLERSAEIGVELYERLARDAAGKDDWFSRAYHEMAHSFGTAVLVLRSVCPRFASSTRTTAENLLFPTDVEAKTNARAVSEMDQLYCNQPLASKMIN